MARVPRATGPRLRPHSSRKITTAAGSLLETAMSGIVWADLVQYAVMTVAAFIVGGIAMHELAAKTLVVPPGWDSPFFGWHLNLDWSGTIGKLLLPRGVLQESNGG